MLKRCYLRVTAAALCSGVIAGFLVACSPIFLPSRPTFIQPISLTVVNDQIAWVQCLADEILVDEIAISTSNRTVTRLVLIFPLRWERPSALSLHGSNRLEISVLFSLMRLGADRNETIGYECV